MAGRVATVAVGAGLIAGLAAASYPLFWRRQCLTWGATDAEVTASLPGDELLPVAGIVSTRAITIDAEPRHIWPWLVQMGSGRAGGYSYDWVQNLFGLDMHSAKVVLPQFQDLSVGQEFAIGLRGWTMRVEWLDQERALAFSCGDRSLVRIYVLSPAGTGRTRLITRYRIASPGLPPLAWAWSLLIEPVSLVMERKMQRGVKERAERLARSPHAAAPRPAR
jgi:hypothetical protein